MPDEEQKISEPESATPAEAGAHAPEKSPEDICAEYEAQTKRALADYANLQKEVARQREDMGAFAVFRVIERFLPALDYFRAALSHKPDPDKLEAWFVGIGHIQNQFDTALSDLGIKKIATLGQKFDATKHEAVGEEESEGKEAGEILREVMAGYEINGKVVRPARVIVKK